MHDSAMDIILVGGFEPNRNELRYLNFHLKRCFILQHKVLLDLCHIPQWKTLAHGKGTPRLPPVPAMKVSVSSKLFHTSVDYLLCLFCNIATYLVCWLKFSSVCYVW